MGVRDLELVAPAGSLTAGLYALKAGADSVYFGLSRFSARQTAENLTFSDVRRLKGMARTVDARVFAALNTIISDNERAEIKAMLPELVLCGIDGIIVQDLGLASYIRRCFPSLPVHGSTQLAVHNRLGIETAHRLGLKRVVLSRELSLEEIGALRDVSGALEREVFVHGALCYGFSGLCLASAMLTARSGNRGACAQICRSWFDHRQEKGYYFSLSDLDAGDLVSELESVGVTALKIEGRLKSLAYVDNTTRYYRALLDGDRDKAAYHRNLSALGFSRPKSRGFLTPEQNVRLTNPDYPSHVGIPGAKVERVQKGRITILALAPLSAHDRLFRRPKGPPNDGDTFPLDAFWIGTTKRRRIEPGERAALRGRFRVTRGEILMKTLAHDMHLKKLGTTARPYRTLLPLYVASEDGGLRLGTDIFSIRFESGFSVPIEPSRSGSSFRRILGDRFGEAGGGAFSFEGPRAFPDTPPIDDDIFVPPSKLKAIKKAFYQQVENRLRQLPGDDVFDPLPSSILPALPPREEISFEDGFPFLLEGDSPEPADCPNIDGTIYLSLPPVMFQEAATIEAVEKLIRANRHRRISVGLNNIGHLALVHRWERFSELFFYIDYGLYAANLWTLRHLFHSVKRLQGAYLWLEATAEQQAAFLARVNEIGGWDHRVRGIDRKHQLPIFISRACWYGYSGKTHCRRKCSGSFETVLRQNGRDFRVHVKDCITYVFIAT